MFKQITQHLIQLKTQFRRSRQGFTLIEVVAVMAIIGVLAVAMIPSIGAAIDKSTDTKIISKLTMVDGAAKVYKLETGEYPTTIADLQNGKYLPPGDYKGTDGVDFNIEKDGSANAKGANGILSSKAPEKKKTL